MLHINEHTEHAQDLGGHMTKCFMGNCSCYSRASYRIFGEIGMMCQVFTECDVKLLIIQQ